MENVEAYFVNKKAILYHLGILDSKSFLYMDMYLFVKS